MKKKLLLLQILLTFSLHAQFTDDFEMYNLGLMVDQNSNIWSTWSENVVSQSIIVNDIQSLSGNKSGYVGAQNNNDTDAFLLLGNKPSGLWTLKFSMFIPSNKQGYFNIQGETSSSGGVGSAVNTFISSGVYFNQNNTNPGVGIHLDSGINFNFPHDAWFEISIFFDVDNLTYQLSVNNTLVNTTPESFSNMNTILGAINFYGGSLTSITSYWIDDVQFVSGTLSLEKNIVNNNIVLFPNPTSGLLKINYDNNLIIDLIIVYNTLGEIVKKTTNIDEIDISNISNGIYYLSILSSNNDKIIYKIIKE